MTLRPKFEKAAATLTAALFLAVFAAGPARGQDWLGAPTSCDWAEWDDAMQRAVEAVNACHDRRNAELDAALRRGDESEVGRLSAFGYSEACDREVSIACLPDEERACLLELARQRQERLCAGEGRATTRRAMPRAPGEGVVTPHRGDENPVMDVYLHRARGAWNALGLVRRRLGLMAAPIQDDVAVHLIGEHLRALPSVSDALADAFVSAMLDQPATSLLEPHELLRDVQDELARVLNPGRAGKEAVFAAFVASLPDSKRAALSDRDVAWALVGDIGYYDRREIDAYVAALSGGMPYAASSTARANEGPGRAMTSAEIGRKERRVQQIVGRTAIESELRRRGDSLGERRRDELLRELERLDAELARL